MSSRKLNSFPFHALLLLSIAFAQATTAYAAPPTPQQQCVHLSEQLTSIANLNITTTYIPSGTLLNFAYDPSPVCALTGTSLTTTQNLCRVQGTMRTSSSSQVKLELWLPDASQWTGRFLALGNAGLSGCFFWNELHKGAGTHLMATIQTDAGHSGDTAAPLLNNPESLRDFSGRNLVVQHDVGLAVTKAYYSQSPARKYFMGCSMGGRQGFQLAQTQAGFYDGIVAGAPALEFPVVSGYAWKLDLLMGTRALPSESKVIIGSADLELVTKEVLRQCDGIDGVVNGILDNPDECDFDAEAILCTQEQLDGGNTAGVCLTERQVEVFKAIFSPLLDAQGNVLSSRFDPGFTSSNPLLWGNSLSAYYAAGVYQDIVYNNANFNMDTFTDADILYAKQTDPGNLSTWNTNLSPFKKSGAKLVSYHGTADSILPSGNTERYYRSVKAAMNNRTLDGFWKHFPIPGADHCFGSTRSANASWNFGGFMQSIDGVKTDATHDVLLAMVNWVEKGVSPTGLVGTKFVNDVPTLGVATQRTYCPLPKKSVLRKGMDPTKADSWVCK